ncbi:hypothetical protein [Rubripirellula reticaptiva]|uniref:Uncharacterized protein n=1 Tax=Rubripirellula reticaptiva TaxID=2528013 RepID=A0A5C6F4C1_9BACT|nr:hypothetical protein [Rubripirellula reticaptiva]TWU56198.1 hypothetical protein Poly59_25020 [Rubripirellula reticaptiva]
MPTRPNPTILSAIDSAVLARIVGEVIARLKASQSVVVESKIIDAKTIGQYAVGATITIAARAIVTPAAKDEAKQRNITITRDAVITQESIGKPSCSVKIMDSDHQRAESVEAQLVRRGINLAAASVVLSDAPALEVASQFGSGKRAVMIGSLDDVNRFGREVDPQVWVLDMKRLNLIAAVNVISAITRFRSVSK